VITILEALTVVVNSSRRLQQCVSFYRQLKIRQDDMNQILSCSHRVSFTEKCVYPSLSHPRKCNLKSAAGEDTNELYSDG
jgi:hypothetical protein